MDNDLLNINVNIPNKLSIYKEDINTIIEKDEEVIKKYLEKSVFNCILSDSVKFDLNKIFEESKQIVLEKF
jgi:hypothetical protein